MARYGAARRTNSRPDTGQASTRSWSRSAVPRTPPAGRIDQPLARGDVVDVDAGLRWLACRGPERLPCSPGGLRLSVQLDRDRVGPVGVDPRADLLELIV